MKKKYFYLKLALTLIALPCVALALHNESSQCTLPELAKTPAGAEDSLPQQAEADTGHFSLKNLPGVQLTIPRGYLMPEFSGLDGERERLILRFHFYPGMKELVSEKTMRARAVLVAIASKYDVCTAHWGSAYLGHEFASFQAAIEFFPEFVLPFTAEEHAKALPPSHPSHIIKFLENGQIDPATGLMAYPGKQCNEGPAGGKVCDVMYLPPQADSCNPKEWINCRKNICEQIWFRDGCYIVVWFGRTLMLHHADIRKAVDLKLDEFIHHKKKGKGVHSRINI
jgi:hypothetical protein